MKKFILLMAMVAVACFLSFHAFHQKKVVPEVFKESEPEKPILVEQDVKTYPNALTLGREFKKPVFVYFGATWCPPCKTMKANTLNDARVKDKLTNYIVLIVDCDQDTD